MKRDILIRRIKIEEFLELSLIELKNILKEDYDISANHKFAEYDCKFQEIVTMIEGMGFDGSNIKREYKRIIESSIKEVVRNRDY